MFQRCIALEDGKDLLRDIHAGTCGHHAGSRSLVAKAFRAGFYWPTALRDAEDIVKRCIGCQKFASKPHAPASALKTIPLTWPFAQWKLNMMRPLKKSSKRNIQKNQKFGITLKTKCGAKYANSDTTSTSTLSYHLKHCHQIFVNPEEICLYICLYYLLN